MKSMHPHPIYQSGWDNQRGRSTYEQTGTNPGMSTAHFFLGHILTGLASNPATMLNIEEHLDYAIKLAELAHNKTQHWMAY